MNRDVSRGLRNSLCSQTKQCNRNSQSIVDLLQDEFPFPQIVD